MTAFRATPRNLNPRPTPKAERLHPLTGRRSVKAKVMLHWRADMLNTFFNAVTKAIAHSASERAAYVKRNQPANNVNVKRHGSTATATERVTFYPRNFNPNILDMPGDDLFDFKI